MGPKAIFLFGAVVASCVLLAASQEDTCGLSQYPDAGECDSEGAECSPPEKVVGGIEARANELPYQVALHYNGGFFCGGILWDELHVITAAHCTAGDPAENHSVLLGEHIRSETNPARLEIGCEEIIEHEDYRPLTLENDIAIMVLSEPIPSGDETKVPICYSADNGGDNTFGLPSVVSGWGAPRSGGSVTDELRYAEIPVLDFDTCSGCEDFNAGDITPGMICAGFCDDNEKDTCQGDSGGPLAVKVGEQFFGVGITSWGYGCASTTPGVYTDIAFYEDWINANITP